MKSKGRRHSTPTRLVASDNARATVLDRARGFDRVNGSGFAPKCLFDWFFSFRWSSLNRNVSPVGGKGSVFRVFLDSSRQFAHLALTDSKLQLGRQEEAGWPLENLGLLLLKLRKLKTFSAFVTRGSYDNDLQDLTSLYLFYPYDLNRKYRDKPRLTQTDLINKSLQLLLNITTYPRLSVSKQEKCLCCVCSFSSVWGMFRILWVSVKLI